jgi:hypothetical protein
MRIARPSALSLAALAVLTLSVGGDPPKPQKKSSIMEKKLGAAKKVLEGLALNNMLMVKENADLLNDLSKQARPPSPPPEWRAPADVSSSAPDSPRGSELPFEQSLGR